jgi:hypothetical protein
MLLGVIGSVIGMLLDVIGCDLIASLCAVGFFLSVLDRLCCISCALGTLDCYLTALLELHVGMFFLYKVVRSAKRSLSSALR